MDVVGHNVDGFDSPSAQESAHIALANEAQALYCDPGMRTAYKGGKDGALALPPCVCEAGTFEFAACQLEPPPSKATEKHDLEVPRPGQRPQEFSGALFLIGGHADDTFYELLKLAPKNPKVVVVGRASGLPGADESLAEDFFKAGVKLDDITIVVPSSYKASDTRFKHSYDVPADADIIYFGGGAQDKLRREFDDHQLEQVQQLLVKGALIAGNSAGTAVMSKEMITGGDEQHLDQAHGFGLTPWAIMDTHVGQRHREARDVKALYEIGNGERPVIGLDEDTRVRFYWNNGKLLGEIGGKGNARIFQTPDMPPLNIENRPIMSKIVTDGSEREANVWELKDGDTFEVRIAAAVSK